MLTLNLMPIFAARGIERPYSFLVKAGFSPHSATNILHSDTRVFRLDHIEKLCDILICEPNDLLKWMPNGKQQYPNNYPLMKLNTHETDANIKDTLTTMPFKELKEVAKEFNESIKQKNAT